MTDSTSENENGNTDASTRARFQQADALFDSALDLDTAKRIAYVHSATVDDPTLRARVLTLLAAHDQSGEFLATPVAADAQVIRLQSVVGSGYHVLSKIGAGGMANVYLADDVKHARRVAIKVFTTDDAGNDAAENTKRFLSEIRVMAHLQHPNLLPLFDSGAGAGLMHYVMPYVNGETLRDRLKRESPLPIDEALRLARAIAGAIQHAHAEGIVHRDLKPANILLRDGQPLVADFGIALTLADKNEQRMTRSGMLLGTAQYMSPEQAMGEQEIDARTDVYALGAILYEMLTGEPPHVASTMQALLAKVCAEHPIAVHLLRDTIPLSVSAAVDRALNKRPVDRFQSMREFEDALNAPATTVVTPAAITAQTEKKSRGWLMPVAGAALILAAVATGFFALQKDSPTQPASRFVVAPLADAAIGRTPSITPDGASLVYAGSAATGRRLFVRNVNELAAHALPGTEGALSTFISPDGKWIGFITADDKLQKVALQGGTPSVVTGVFRYADAVWAGNSRLVVASYGQQGLSWASAAGGELHVITRLDTARRESGHVRPFVLPDEKHVVFLIARDRAGPGPSLGELAMVTLDSSGNTSPAVTRLGVESRGVVGYVNGWLVHVAADGSGIMAIRLDADAGRTQGQALQVLEQADGGVRIASLAKNGTLLYTRAVDANAPVIVDSSGFAKPLFEGVTGSFMNPRLSPDGSHLVMQVTNKAGNDVWVYDVANGTPLHITSHGGALGPTWTPDGKSVLFFSTRGGVEAAWRADASGSSAPEKLLTSTGLFGLSVAQNNELVFQRMINGVWSIWSAKIADSIETNRVVKPIITERYDAFMPSMSPDAKWLAYAANESGRYEIYVRPFPGPGTAVRVSQDGGTEPLWSRDGSRLYFRGDRRMYVANVSTAAQISVTNRHVLFTDAFDGDMPMPHRNYDLTRDGKFVMIAANTGDAPQTIVVLNWLDELKVKLAAAK